MKKRTIPSIILAISVAMSAGCGPSGDGGPDECDAFAPWETGGEGADVSVPPPAWQARAGRITAEAHVPRGLKSQAEVGDIMMRNSRVLFVIEQPGASDGYNPFGGGIVFADLVGEDGQPMGRNNFGESFHGLAVSLLDAESVTVLADGTDGEEAVVRVVGEMRNMPLLDVAFGFMFETSHGAIYILDYVLGPESEFLELRLHIRNPHPAPSTRYVNLLIFGAIMGDGLALFTPEKGFELGELSGRHALFGHVGEEISYGWMDADGGTLSYVMEESKILVGDKGEEVRIERCSELTVPVIRLLVAGGGAESLLAAARRARGEEEPASVTFQLAVEGGADPSAGRVHVTRPDGTYVTTTIADEGRWRAGLGPGSYLATAVLAGHAPVRDQAFEVDATGASVDITVGEASTVTYTVRDESGAAVPAKVMLVPETPDDLLPASFGEPRFPAGATLYVFDPGTGGSVMLPPGSYTAIASRGYEYEVDEQDFTAVAGEETVLDLVIEHSVDSSGIQCGDFHVHSIHSPDTSTPRGEKVRAAAAEGLEILVSTDHEWVADYQVDVVAEGLQAWVHGVSGEEVTTYDYGHFNAYPQTVREDRPNQGAIDWYYRTPEDVFGEIHSDPLDPVLQINHPRGGTSLGGYFEAAGLDPVAGTVSHPDIWVPDFEAVEVWNGDDFRSQEGEANEDWFALLDMGLRFSAMGNSDSHDLPWSEVGYPRSCLLLGHDVTADLTNLEISDAVTSLRVIVSGGILVTAEGPAGEGPGEVIDAPSGTADVRVRVQAPTWMSADRLRVFVSGVEVETIALDGSTTDPAVRLDEVIVVSTDGGDGWVVFVAEGDTTMDPVTAGRLPFGVTNPLFLDGDGDGVFTPPRTLPGQ